MLGNLVNQEGITLLMATLGITYFLDGFVGQTLFGSQTSTRSTSACPKDPIFLLEGVFQGGILVNKEDSTPPVIAAVLVACCGLFFQKTATGRAARGGRRPPGGAVDRHPARASGHRLERGRLRRGGGRHHLGQQAGRAVLAVAGGAEGLPVVILGGLTSVPGRHHRRADHRRGREAVEVYLGPMIGGGIEIWFAYVLALAVPAGPAAGAVRREIIDRV